MNAQNKLEIRLIQTQNGNMWFDFFIDRVQLSTMLGIDRLENMCFCYFSLDVYLVDKKKYPDYDNAGNIRRAVEIFMGNRSSTNRYGSKRVILYKCHCGDDLCGVISFKLRLDDTYIYWDDVRAEMGEPGEDEGLDFIPVIRILQFDRQSYTETFKHFLSKYVNV